MGIDCMADQVCTEFLSLMDWKLLSALQLETKSFSPLREKLQISWFSSFFQIMNAFFFCTEQLLFLFFLQNSCWFYQGRLSAIFLLNDVARQNFQHHFQPIEYSLNILFEMYKYYFLNQMQKKNPFFALIQRCPLSKAMACLQSFQS